MGGVNAKQALSTVSPHRIDWMPDSLISTGLEQSHEEVQRALPVRKEVKMEQRTLPTIDEFKSITGDKVRYCDTDRQGHVNNAIFSSFLETGRVEILYNQNHPLYAEGCSFVIALARFLFSGTREVPQSLKKLPSIVQQEAGYASFYRFLLVYVFPGTVVGQDDRVQV